MSRILNTIRGSYTAINVKKSVIALTGELKGLPYGKGILVVGFNVSDVEKSSTIQCFGGVNHIYAFGHDPDQSAFSVTYLVFLGKKSCPKDEDAKFEVNDTLSEVVTRYNKTKVSKLKKTIKLICGSGVSYTCIVLGMSSSVHDPELNLVSVTLTGKIVR